MQVVVLVLSCRKFNEPFFQIGVSPEVMCRACVLVVVEAAVTALGACCMANGAVSRCCRLWSHRRYLCGWHLCSLAARGCASRRSHLRRSPSTRYMRLAQRSERGTVLVWSQAAIAGITSTTATSRCGKTAQQTGSRRFALEAHDELNIIRGRGRRCVFFREKTGRYATLAAEHSSLPKVL